MATVLFSYPNLSSFFPSQILKVGIFWKKAFFWFDNQIRQWCPPKYFKLKPFPFLTSVYMRTLFLLIWQKCTKYFIFPAITSFRLTTSRRDSFLSTLLAIQSYPHPAKVILLSSCFCPQFSSPETPETQSG